MIVQNLYQLIHFYRLILSTSISPNPNWKYYLAILIQLYLKNILHNITFDLNVTIEMLG